MVSAILQTMPVVTTTGITETIDAAAAADAATTILQTPYKIASAIPRRVRSLVPIFPAALVFIWENLVTLLPPIVTPVILFALGNLTEPFLLNPFTRLTPFLTCSGDTCYKIFQPCFQLPAVTVSYGNPGQLVELQ